MDFEKLTELIIELEVDDIADAVKEALDEGKDPFDVLNALTKGMDEVGRRYEEKDYYLTELVLAGETMKEAFTVLKPALAAVDKSQDKVKIIIGGCVVTELVKRHTGADAFTDDGLEGVEICRKFAQEKS